VNYAVRGLLIGALLPFDVLLVVCAATGTSIVWAFIGASYMTLPSAIIGAFLGGAWELTRALCGGAPEEATSGRRPR
jgi:hypothetical protein